jgi:hypothetical protein
MKLSNSSFKINDKNNNINVKNKMVYIDQGMGVEFCC